MTVSFFLFASIKLNLNQKLNMRDDVVDLSTVAAITSRSFIKQSQKDLKSNDILID